MKRQTLWIPELPQRERRQAGSKPDGCDQSRHSQGANKKQPAQQSSMRFVGPGRGWGAAAPVAGPHRACSRPAAADYSH